MLQRLKLLYIHSHRYTVFICLFRYYNRLKRLLISIQIEKLFTVKKPESVSKKSREPIANFIRGDNT